MLAFALFASVILFGMIGISISNVLSFPRLGRYLLHARRPVPPQEENPLVSILIPARNEAVQIAATLRALLEQDYPRFEILVLDDHSTDQTSQVAIQAAGGDPRVRILPGADLPEGWLGKNWACHQLSCSASGDLLLFTDADVCWSPQALGAMLHLQSVSQADLLTVWPTQVTKTWGERLVVPLMAVTVIGYLPLLAVHHISGPIFAAANGQCLLFRRQAYQTVGGHASVRNLVIEDIQLARLIKRAHLRLRMADGDGLILCRMYSSWQQVRDGYAKNILAGYGGWAGLLLAVLFHWVIFLGPWLWLLLGGILPGLNAGLPWPTWPLALLLLGLGVRFLSAALTRQRLRDGWLMPVSVLLMTRISIQAIWWKWRYGGPLWKGRVVKTRS